MLADHFVEYAPNWYANITIIVSPSGLCRSQDWAPTAHAAGRDVSPSGLFYGTAPNGYSTLPVTQHPSVTQCRHGHARPLLSFHILHRRVKPERVGLRFNRECDGSF